MPMEGRLATVITLTRDTFTTHKGRDRNGTKLLRIAELAKSDPKMKFTSLAHLLNKQSTSSKSS